MYTTARAKIGNQDFGFGLGWYTLNGAAISKEVNEAVTESRRPIGLVRRVRRDNVVTGYQAGLTADSHLVGSYSASAMVADHVRDCVIVYQIDEEHFWFCSIFNGEVAPDGDIVLESQTEAIEHLSRLYGEIGDFSDVRLLVSADVLAQVDSELEPSVEGGFEGWLAKAGVSPNRSHKIKPQRGLPVAGIGIVCFSLALAGVIFAYQALIPKPIVLDEDYSRLQVNMPAIPAAQIDTGKTETTLSPQQILEKARNEEIAWLTYDFNTRPPGPLVGEFVRAVRSLPRVVDGWRITRIVFDAADGQKINVSWQKAATGLKGARSSLTERFSNAEFTFPTDGRTAEMSLPMNPVEPRSISDISAYLTESDFSHVKWMDMLDRHRINWQMNRLEQIPRAVPIQGISDKGFDPAQRLFRTPMTEVRIMVNGMLEAQRLIPILEAGKTMLVSRIVLNNANGAQTWVLYGEIYEPEIR